MRSSTSPRWSSRRATSRRRGGWWVRYLELDARLGVGAEGGAGHPLRGPADGAGRRVTDFLFDGPEGAAMTVLLAHGAGAPMDSAAMTAAARALAGGGAPGGALRVRLHGGPAAGRAQAAAAGGERDAGISRGGGGAGGAGRLVIGGKSMGGRVASMVADELHAAGSVAGLLCLGYPFHPPGRPEQLRTKHLQALATPALIVQGTRDPFGSAGGGGGLSALAGDPRPLARGRRPRPEAAQGASRASPPPTHLATMAREVAAWAGRLPG